MLAAFLGIHDATTAAAVVAVIVAFVTALATAPIRFVTERRLHRAQAATDYEYDQRKELRAKIGTYQGRLLEAAANLNYRINEIYRSRSKGWLNVDGDYTKRWPRGYFFNSTVLRLITFVAVAESFEREAIYIDAVVSTPMCRATLSSGNAANGLHPRTATAEKIAVYTTTTKVATPKPSATPSTVTKPTRTSTATGITTLGLRAMRAKYAVTARLSC